MKIQYCSDLHLEFQANENFLKRNPIVPTGEILILAGDILLFSEMNNYSEFFDYLSKNFKAVYWIPGNHEYYHSDMMYRIGSFREEIRDNVFLLNNWVEIIGNVRFVFSTLWSLISKEAEYKIQRELNDFRLITIDRKRLNTEIYNTLHYEATRFLTETLKQKTNAQTVVVTHHVPTLKHYPEKYLGDVLNQAFATELTPLIETSGADYWIYGHHHANIPAFNIGKTVMLTNQVGYVQAKEHLNFDIGASFEVGKYEPAHLGMEALSRQRPVILVHEPGEWINAPCMVKLKEVITLSREEALRLNQDYIGIEHLLLGLIRDGDGLAIKTLSNLEVDPEMLRKTIEDCISNKLAKTNSKPNNISLTKSAENVLKFAVIERITMKSDAIGTEHLLLSILKDKDNLATQLINQYDINYGIFKAQLDSINPTKR